MTITQINANNINNPNNDDIITEILNSTTDTNINSSNTNFDENLDLRLLLKHQIFYPDFLQIFFYKHLADIHQSVFSYLHLLIVEDC